MSIIVERPKLRRFLLSGGRKLVYGRRKTGKTFYTRHVLREHDYYIVRKGGSIYDPISDEEISVPALLRLCRTGTKIILDEFHRAPSRLFDAIHAGECRGDLVLVTSSLHYHERLLLGREAPLLGLFRARRVGLLNPIELLSAPWDSIDRDTFELLVFYQEPSLIGWSLEDIALHGWDFAYSLTGEIIDEEDMALTSRMIGVLEAISHGNTRISEIAQYLYSRGYTSSPSTGHVSKYLAILARIGLIERIPIAGSKRSVYRHASPVTEAAFYLHARYGHPETPIPTGRLLTVLRENIIPRLVERFVERFFSHLLGLRPVVLRHEKEDIDIALARGRRVVLVGEVKWRRNLSTSMLRRVEERLNRVQTAERRILFVPDRSITGETRLEVWDLNRLVQEAKKAFASQEPDSQEDNLTY